MRAALDQLEGLLQFQGLNFRSTTINCSHCSWNGTGGELEVPGLAASGEPVIYACPACLAAVAVHNGLTDQEVMQEMEKIRQLLAAELEGTYLHPEAAADAHFAQPDFAAIRAHLPTAEYVAAEKAAAAANALEQKPADSAALPELDFAAIRARLTVPA